MEKLANVLQTISVFNNDEIQEILVALDTYEIGMTPANVLNIHLKLKHGLRIELIEKFHYFNQLNNGVSFSLFINLDQLDKALISLYTYHFLKQKNDIFLIKSWNKQSFLFDDSTLIIKYFTDNEKSEWMKIEPELIEYYNNYLFTHLTLVKYERDEEFSQALLMNQKKQEAEIIQLEQAIDKISESRQINKVNNKYSSKYEPTLKDKAMSIKDLIIDDQTAIIEGEIFQVKKDVLRNNSLLYTFGITDYTSSINVKQYAKLDTANELDEIKVGDWIKMKIGLENTFYDSRPQLTARLRQWCKIPPKIEKRVDTIEPKRIELCLHTKMTAFDGLITPPDLVKTVKEFGQSGFAVTDRYNVQMYPEIAKAAKNSGLKPIYGIEFEKLPDSIPAVLNPIDKELTNTRYIVFDLETTGLYAQYEDIIEFGAVVYEGNRVVEHKQFFIKPNVPINVRVEELTGISQKDVDNAVDQLTGLKQILDFIKDDVLVAHNGINFDYSFINTKLEQYGLAPLKNCIIDTMVISRALNPEYKSNTLEYICKKNHIMYDRISAHRADYDADVLTEVWAVFVNELKKLGCNSIGQINDHIQTKSLRESTRGNFVLAYAKNQTGIRDIYELVSLSHSQEFFGRPTLKDSDLKKFSENIIIANSPIESDVINAAISKTDDELLEVLSFYDFITVCPPDGLQHEISAGNILVSNIQKAITRIIDKAKLLNKPVVAVSNAYYLEPVEEQYHNVYIHIPVLNRKRHRFYKYGRGPVAYLRTTNEMMDEFAFLNNAVLINDIVVNNTHKIADLISDDISPLKKKLYPPYIEGVNDKVTNTVYENAHKTYGPQLSEIVQKQIEKELNSIIGNGYAVVYWISHLLVSKSIQDGYVVGSRGSVGSSLVATFLNITDVNALPPHYLCRHCCYSDFNVPSEYEDGYDLPYKPCPKCGQQMGGEGHQIPFETFLGFNGDKVPDIDLNFSGVYQPQAHNFIKEMFGKDKAFRAGTISTVAEKTSFGNVRAYFEEIQKDVPNAEIERYAIHCQDVKRTTGQHPGGIVVVPNDMSIYDFTPFNYPADDTNQDWYTTHFAFEYIHDNLLKFDILGHDNPTALRMLKDLTGIDEKDIPNHDEKTMSLFNSLDALGIKPDDLLGETTGAISIPEFGTKFVREMLKDTHPNSFADLIRISGLSHGTDVWLGNAKELIKDGHTLKDVIGCRDDIMVYLINHKIEPLLSFQIMEDVRKGKKIKPNDQEVLRKNNIPEWYIESCNKIKYMFPKAHATAYVMHAWKFAWYKLNYPLEYYATYFSIRPAVFNLEIICSGYEGIKNEYLRINKALNNPKLKNTISNKDKDLIPIYEVAIEMYARGYRIKMIDLNRSDAKNFCIDHDAKEIICPFSALDGLGEQVAESIVAARNEMPFSSKEDLMKRTKLTKQHLETMTRLGILDHLSDTNQISLFDF